MYRYAALLRGIGPSDPNMRNDKLCGVFEGLGFDRVASVISSGNIVFASAGTDVPALESRIQEALRRELGIAGGTIIRSQLELQALVDRDPFPSMTHGRATYLTATFLKHAAEPAGDALPQPGDPAMRVVAYDATARAVLAVTDTTISKTPDFMGWLESRYGKDITTRTWLTVQRVLKKLTS
ncbi:MAG: DUF1697 domain-containing protein [Longimicrobiales bacterium]